MTTEQILVISVILLLLGFGLLNIFLFIEFTNIKCKFKEVEQEIISRYERSQRNLENDSSFLIYADEEIIDELNKAIDRIGGLELTVEEMIDSQNKENI